MRIGVLARTGTDDLDWLAGLGFRSMEWVGFADGPCGTGQDDWKPSADRIQHEVQARDIRISAIAALYANPLDPRQTERARLVFQRAIEVAAHLQIRTVAGFPGAMIQTTINERGGNPIYCSTEHSLKPLLEFWEPLADFARDRGVRIAFEHCPQGPFHLPVMGYNAFGQTAFWEQFFNATRCDNLGIEWDASHLICQFVDPVRNIHKFGARIFHVHAKDAFVNRALLELHGICHPGVAEHRMPGFGQADWGQIIHALVRAGYDSDLNIEGWHDPVFRDHPESAGAPVNPLAGRKLEESGLRIAKQTLERFIPTEGCGA
jgi:sugar phosphate isomerase/epimerase